ncbi:galactose-3-O-sulfotransferase 3-like [Haemaphysalis longicornis]
MRRSCKAKRNVVFLKTHKCAGSSVLNLLLRKAERDGLVLALPKNLQKHLMGYPQVFSPQEHLFNYSQCRGVQLRPNLMALHMRYNETGVREVMPPDTVYVTIIRRPTDLFVSLFYYFKMNEVYDANVTAFLKTPFFVQVIRRSRLHKSLSFNQITFDLGADGDEIAASGDPSALPAFLAAVDRGFHLVMIAERFLESLVLLRDELCWDLDDMITLKHNVRAQLLPGPEPDAIRILEEANRVDEALYAHFLAKFDRAVEAYGRRRMQAEVAALESRTDFWFSRCVDSTIPVPSNVYEYTSRNRTSDAEQRMCQLLTMPEQDFVQRFRMRLFDVCPEASSAMTTSDASAVPRGPR